MSRTNKKLTGTIIAALVATALAPAASIASNGSGAYGQHEPAPAQQGGGAYGQHSPSPVQAPAIQSPVVADDSSSGNGFGWGDGAMVAGGVLVLLALGGLAVRRSHVPATSS